MLLAFALQLSGVFFLTSDQHLAVHGFNLSPAAEQLQPFRLHPPALLVVYRSAGKPVVILKRRVATVADTAWGLPV
jgi:hypothetical protein